MIEVYTDGSGTSRGSAGGWAYVLVRDGILVGGCAGAEPDATNNTMELTAAINGLVAAWMYMMEKGLVLMVIGDKPIMHEPVTLVSDSEYVLGLASGQFSPSANKRFAERVRDISSRLDARLRHVKGHAGDCEWNDIVDHWSRFHKNKMKRAKEGMRG